MTCQKCKSERVLDVTAKCSDLCFVRMGDKEHDGYVPTDCGIGDEGFGDYVEIKVCLECGQLQGKWPRKDPKVLNEKTE